jgi:hypothetical protein
MINQQLFRVEDKIEKYLKKLKIPKEKIGGF